MSEYLHGAYGDVQEIGNPVADVTGSAIVCVGTAPVGQIEGYAASVNTPRLVRNIAEAKRLFGYSDDWAKYTLCEVMHYFLEVKNVGPLVLINVFNPTTHHGLTPTTVSVTPVNGKATIANAGSIILDSLVVKKGTGDDQETLVKGEDYTAVYSLARNSIIISGANLGTAALSVTYEYANPDAVNEAVVIGAENPATGSYTGLYAIKSVYQKTGMIPAYLIAPGFSSVKEIHDVMGQISRKINGHWDAWMFVDLPINITASVEYKETNGFNLENETVYFPMVTGTDGKNYHLSTLAAANFQELLGQNDGIPYHSASNTDAPIIKYLYGMAAAADTERAVYDDTYINKLNKQGIASAAFVSGRWAIWGAHPADYNEVNATDVNTFETNRMMLYYLSNDFQARRGRDVDKPLTANGIASIVADEQRRLDALKGMGALVYGEASLDAESLANSDVYSGDFLFEFRITTMPLAKSMTAVVTWVDEGYSTYYSTGEGRVG